MTEMNKPLSKGDLKSLLESVKREVMLSLNCHHVAKVTAVDYATRLIEAEMLYTKTVYEFNNIGESVRQEIAYPLLLDIPFLVLGGGGARITFPISAGDECLVLFNDRSIDNYIAGAKSGPVSSPRLHSFSDGIALVGFNWEGTIDPNRASLEYGTTRVAVGEQKVLIENQNATLNELLQDLVTNVKDLVTQVAAITVTGVTTGPGTSGPPANVAAITALTAQLTTTGTAIGALLE
jgi:hypothetical protein